MRPLLWIKSKKERKRKEKSEKNWANRTHELFKLLSDLQRDIKSSIIVSQWVCSARTSEDDLGYLDTFSNRSASDVNSLKNKEKRMSLVKTELSLPQFLRRAVWKASFLVRSSALRWLACPRRGPKNRSSVACSWLTERRPRELYNSPTPLVYSRRQASR